MRFSRCLPLSILLSLLCLYAQSSAAQSSRVEPLEGKWYLFQIQTGDGPSQTPAWVRGVLDMDAGGDFSALWRDSGNNVTTSTGTFHLDASGVVTVTATPQPKES